MYNFTQFYHKNEVIKAWVYDWSKNYIYEIIFNDVIVLTFDIIVFANGISF